MLVDVAVIVAAMLAIAEEINDPEQRDRAMLWLIGQAKENSRTDDLESSGMENTNA